MLVKLITVVNFTNILQAAFALKFLHLKIPSQTVTTEKLRKTLSNQKGERKMLVKSIAGRLSPTSSSSRWRTSSRRRDTFPSANGST